MDYETCSFHLIFSKRSGDGKILKKKCVLDILDIYHTSPTSLISETIRIINSLNSDVVDVLIELDDRYLDAGKYFVRDVAVLLESTAKLIYEGDYSVEEFYYAHQLLGKSLLLFINKHKALPAIVYKYEVVRFSDDGTEMVTDTFINSNYEDLMKEVRS